MNAFLRLLSRGRALVRAARELAREEEQRAAFAARHPGVHVDWPVRFLVDEPAALTLAPGTCIGAFSEIIVLRAAAQSPVAGGLRIGPGVHLGMGANVRAAGGLIDIGARTQLGQHVSLIASNHRLDPATGRPAPDQWAADKTGVAIGADCWIGAGAIILPGVVIGDGAVIAAGSIVTKPVGAGQTWRGQPARPAPPRA
jgi:acetyltransferase-like isoleucine patch superfamily enzyme